MLLPDVLPSFLNQGRIRLLSGHPRRRKEKTPEEGNLHKDNLFSSLSPTTHQGTSQGKGLFSLKVTVPELVQYAIRQKPRLSGGLAQSLPTPDSTAPS